MGEPKFPQRQKRVGTYLMDGGIGPSFRSDRAIDNVAGIQEASCKLVSNTPVGPCHRASLAENLESGFAFYMIS